MKQGLSIIEGGLLIEAGSIGADHEPAEWHIDLRRPNLVEPISTLR